MQPNKEILPTEIWKKKPETVADFNRLRHRAKYAPFVLRMWVPEWKTFILPIRAISLN